MKPTSSQTRNGRHDPGFTMAEILIVVGIIALVTAIAAPSIAVARRKAKGVECLNNLRQMSAALAAYAGHFEGSFPPAIYNVTVSGTTYANGWDYTIITRAGFPDVTIRPGLLWQGQTDLRVMQCPVFEGSAMAANNPYTGYNYNTSYLGRGTYATTLFDPPARISSVVDPSGTVVFGDGEYASGADKYMRSPRVSGFPSDMGVPRFAGTQGFRHGGRTNMAFVDGHAESTDARYVVGTSIAEGTGFLSPDNSMYDLK